MKMHQTIFSVNQNTSTNGVKSIFESSQSIFKFFLPWVLQFFNNITNNWWNQGISHCVTYRIFLCTRDLQNLWFVPLKGLIFRFLTVYNAFGKQWRWFVCLFLWFTPAYDAFRKCDPGQSQQRPRNAGKIFLPLICPENIQTLFFKYLSYIY